jgi:hypothetical protein
VEDPELQKFHFQQVEGMLLSTFIAGLIGNAGQQVRFKLPQTLDEVLQIADTTFEMEAQEKKMKFLIQTRGKQSVHVGASIGKSGHSDQQLQVSIWKGSKTTVRQEDSRLSKYIAYPRDAGCRTGPCFVMIAIDRDPMLHTAIS